jgi:hypothetical protein
VFESAERHLGRWENAMVASAGIGVFLSVKYAVPAMRRARVGSIIMSWGSWPPRVGRVGQLLRTKGGVRLFAKRWLWNALRLLTV